MIKYDLNDLAKSLVVADIRFKKKYDCDNGKLDLLEILCSSCYICFNSLGLSIYGKVTKEHYNIIERVVLFWYCYRMDFFADEDKKKI